MLLAVAFKVGKGLTSIVIVCVELTQFVVSPITVYVVCVVGATTVEFVVTINGLVMVYELAPVKLIVAVSPKQILFTLLDIPTVGVVLAIIVIFVTLLHPVIVFVPITLYVVVMLGLTMAVLVVTEPASALQV